MNVRKANIRLDTAEHEVEAAIAELQRLARREHANDAAQAQVSLRGWRQLAEGHAVQIEPVLDRRQSGRLQAEQDQESRLRRAIETHASQAVIDRIIAEDTTPRGETIPVFRSPQKGDVNEAIQNLSFALARRNLALDAAGNAASASMAKMVRAPQIADEKFRRKLSLRSALNEAGRANAPTKMSTLPPETREECDYARTFIYAETVDGPIRLAPDHPVRGGKDFEKLCEAMRSVSLPNWGKTTDALKFQSVCVAASSYRHSISFTCNFGSMVIDNAENSSKRIKRHLQERLKKMFDRLPFDCRSAFVFETEPKLHVHGILCSNSPDFDEALVRRKLRTWTVGAGQTSEPTDVSVKPLTKPASWAVYVCKRLGVSRKALGDLSALSAGDELRREAKASYRTIKERWDQDVLVKRAGR